MIQDGQVMWAAVQWWTWLALGLYLGSGLWFAMKVVWKVLKDPTTRPRPSHPVWLKAFLWVITLSIGLTVILGWPLWMLSARKSAAER